MNAEFVIGLVIGIAAFGFIGWKIWGKKGDQIKKKVDEYRD